MVVEDLISTGGSSLEVVAALREAGCTIKGMVAIFTYNLPRAEKGFAGANCLLVTLSDYDILVKKALEINYITEEDLFVLRDFKQALLSK